MARPIDQRAIGGHQHPSAPGGHRLVAVEGEHPDVAERTGGAVVPRGAHRLGCVLDDRHASGIAQLADRPVVGALPVEVDGDDGAHPSAVGGGSIERIGHQGRIEVPRVGPAVDEQRLGAEVPHGVGGGGERERGHDDEVAGAHARDEEREVQPGGAAGQRDGVLHTETRGELAFERVEVGPRGRDPVGVERAEQQVSFLDAHVGW